MAAYSDYRIIFAGTPMFAVASLDRLVKNHFQVVAVITAPDKPAGRGRDLQESDVKKYASGKNIPVLQPEKLADPGFLQAVEKLKPDLMIVVAFRMMPEKLWRLPRLGTFNLHASLLPQYRGAAPINHAVMNGEKETGVTTFFLRQEIDTGDILYQEKVPISENETAGELHDKLMMTGAKLLVHTTEHILNGDYTTRRQEAVDPGQVLKPAPKIFKDDCRISWNAPALVIHNFIRGLSPYPTAFSGLLDPDGKRHTLKIYAARPVVQSHNLQPGMVDTDRKGYLHIYCRDGYLDIAELQLPGKRRMPAAELLRGFQINEEWRAE